LKDAGFDMTIDNTKAGDLFGQVLPTGDFQAAIYAQVLTTLQPSTCNLFCSKNAAPLGQKGGNNYTRTNVPALDDVLIKQDAELDPNQAVTEGRQAEKIKADNAVSLPIDPLPNILLWGNNVVGPIGDNGLLGPFFNMNEWGVTS